MNGFIEFIVNTLAEIANKYLTLYWMREDVKDITRLEIYNGTLLLQQRAEEWKNKASIRNSDIARILGVSERAGEITSVDGSTLAPLNDNAKNN